MPIPDDAATMNTGVGAASPNENNAKDAGTPQNGITPSEQTKTFEELLGPGFSDNTPVSKLMELFDISRGKQAQADSKRDSHEFGDAMSLGCFREVTRKMYSEPLALMSLASTLSARQSDAEDMRADLERKVPESPILHDMVDGVSQLVTDLPCAATPGEFLWDGDSGQCGDCLERPISQRADEWRY